jgi:hypothetical protein
MAGSKNAIWRRDFEWSSSRPGKCRRVGHVAEFALTRFDGRPGQNIAFANENRKTFTENQIAKESRMRANLSSECLAGKGRIHITA